MPSSQQGRQKDTRAGKLGPFESDPDTRDIIVEHSIKRHGSCPDIRDRGTSTAGIHEKSTSKLRARRQQPQQLLLLLLLQNHRQKRHSATVPIAIQWQKAQSHPSSTAKQLLRIQHAWAQCGMLISMELCSRVERRNQCRCTSLGPQSPKLIEPKLRPDSQVPGPWRRALPSDSEPMNTQSN